MANTDIKGVIFDYGGTIDSRGDHWSEVIWDGYREAGVQVTKEQFRDCYVYAERELAKTRLVENAVLPSDYPVEEKALAVARYCYNRAKESVEEARQVLEFVHERVPMVLVSNFYGNVETVLADFDLARYFKKVVESAVVGIRKPDPRIFALGVEALGVPAENVLVVGDSYKKDIVPAESIGCQVAWLKGKGWTAEEDAVTHPEIIKKLEEIEKRFV